MSVKERNNFIANHVNRVMVSVTSSATTGNTAPNVESVQVIVAELMESFTEYRPIPWLSVVVIIVAMMMIYTITRKHGIIRYVLPLVVSSGAEEGGKVSPTFCPWRVWEEVEVDWKEVEIDKQRENRGKSQVKKLNEIK